jgi:FecR protein/Putative zinc-finger
MFTRHVTKKLSAYCHEELSIEESRRFTEHIIACAKCHAELAEIKLGIKFAEQLPQLSAPDRLWTDLESLLENTRVSLPPVSQSKHFITNWRTQLAVLAAVMLLVTTFGVWWLLRDRLPADPRSSWLVERLDGTPRIGSSAIANKGQLGVGQWLETDSHSRAQIIVSSIGQVEIGANTRVKLLETQPSEHRLELARGKMSARIWAPPRLFFVDTPSAVAADLGCAYTLEVDDSGGSLLRVTSGWVALELKDRESMVPAGAACQTRPGIGPGTPYFEDASVDFRQALATLDFGNDLSAKNFALQLLLGRARPRDTLTLWHLLARVDGKDRDNVYEKIAGFVPPPPGVTREGVLRLDQEMLELWRDQLERTWADSNIFPKKVAAAYWRIKNGVNRRVGEVK